MLYMLGFLQSAVRLLERQVGGRINLCNEMKWINCMGGWVDAELMKYTQILLLILHSILREYMHMFLVVFHLHFDQVFDAVTK